MSTINRGVYSGTLQDKMNEHFRNAYGATNEEVANTQGRIFRNFPLKFSLNVGTQEVLKFICTKDVRLISRVIVLSSGGVLYEVLVGGSETGTYTPVTISCTNQRNPSGSTSQILRGGISGGLTGGTLIDDAELQTPSGGQSQTIPDAQIGGRILAAGSTFYLRMTGLSNGTVARLYLLWEEGDGF